MATTGKAITSLDSSQRSASDIATSVEGSIKLAVSKKQELEALVKQSLEHQQRHGFDRFDKSKNTCCKDSELYRETMDMISEIVEARMPFNLLSILSAVGLLSEERTRHLFYTSAVFATQQDEAWLGSNTVAQLRKLTWEGVTTEEFTFHSVEVNLRKLVEEDILVPKRIETHGTSTYQSGRTDTFYTLTPKGREVVQLLLDSPSEIVAREQEEITKKFKKSRAERIQALHNISFMGTDATEMFVITLLLKIRDNPDQRIPELEREYNNGAREVLWTLLELGFVDFRDTGEKLKRSISASLPPIDIPAYAFSITPSGEEFLSTAIGEYGKLAELLRSRAQSPSK